MKAAPVLVDVHGSCVSRSCFKLIDQSKIQVLNNFSRNHIVSCMMPPANISFSHGELVKYSSEYAERCMRLALNKQTVPLLLESSSEYLVIDFFDLCQPVAAYFDTTFSTYDYTFYNTAAYQEHNKQMKTIDFINIPVCLWYGYVDRYFQLMAEKFNGKLILNRLDCSGIYLNRQNKINDIPKNLLLFGDPKHNQLLCDLENYVIDRYHPFVVDISKYFIPDEHYNPDTTPVHYEEGYEAVQSGIILEIVSGGGHKRYFDTLPLSVVSSLLERPVSDSDFLKIYSKRALPFETDTVLDFFFQAQEIDEVMKNRRFIASVYRKYDKAQADCGSCREIIEQLLDDASIWRKGTATESPFIKDTFHYLRDVNRILENDPSELYRLFLLDFQKEDARGWMFKLNLLSIIAPEYEDVPAYLAQFYQAAGDGFFLRKLFANQYRA